MRVKKTFLSGRKAYVDAFLDMWSEGGIIRMAELGCYVDNIRDEAELLRAVCMHLLDISLLEYQKILEKVPQLNPQSWQYGQLRSEVRSQKQEWEEGEMAQWLHVEIINLAVAEYNRNL